MFQVLHSSAGAGKTHALVKHYLTLCLTTSDPGSYRQILALTFTNKAASEMKERVVGYLRKIARGQVKEGAIADVVDHLEQRTGLGTEALSHRADVLLRHMLHHWSEVAISTIDAFTRRVVQPFSRDLQLDHDLRMTTEQDHYLSAAVDRLVAEAGVDPKVTTILTEACLQLLHQEQRWDPELPLRALSGELLKENSIGPLSRIATLDATAIQAIGQRLRQQEREFREQARALGQEALQLLSDAGITAEEMSYGDKGIHSTFNKLANFGTKWVSPGTNARKPLATGKWHSGKADASTVAALNALAPRLQQLFEQAEELMQNGYGPFLIRQAVMRDLPATYALHALEQHLAQLKKEDGVAFFSDLTRKVAEVVASEPVPFIHERLGERYQHYLIDEFQDTSLLQWTCLLPLIDNALSSGGSALLVGDAKQAIYRWRNGEVRLFVELPKLFGNTGTALERERELTLQRSYRGIDPLRYNRRSSPVIIAFNNTLFGALAAGLPEQLQAVYSSHAQHHVGTGPGLVRIEVITDSAPGEDRWAPLLNSLVLAIDQSLADGCSPGDIAVLVRSGSMGARVARHLLSLGHSVVSPDGLRLAGDPLVELLIDVLRAVHLGDAAAAARVMQYRARLSCTLDQDEVDPFAQAASLPDPHAELMAELARLELVSVRTTIPDLLLRLCHWLHVRPAEEAAIVALLDEAHSWGRLNGPRVGEFIAHWDTSGNRRSVSPPEDGHAIQVMTIHKAKGLEFPVVIVADATMHSRGSRTESLWVDPRPAVPDLQAALIRESKALVESGVPELVEEQDLRQLDDLNLLYVAFTRPAQRLYAFLYEDATDHVSKGLLQFIVEHGKDGILVQGERSTLITHQTGNGAQVLRDVSTPSGPIALEMRFERPSGWTPEGELDRAMQLGRTFHAVLAHIRTSDDVDTALDRAGKEGDLVPEDRDAVRTALLNMVREAALAPWFSSSAEVRTESTIIDAAGRAWRPDRVVIEKGVVRILDLKTGVPKAEHHDQVAGYMALLGQMGHPNVEGALFYLTTSRLELVNP